MFDKDAKKGDTAAVEDVFIFPASFAQQRLWFLNQFEPESPAYNVSAAVRLDGRLDLDALHRSLNEIIARHEALRTTFSEIDGSPMQVIASSLEIDLPLIKLDGGSRLGKDEEILRRARDEARVSFDLSAGPLIRASVLEAGQHEHVLLLSMHHIISDGWSIGVFVSEMTALYQSFAAGVRHSLPELEIQYADFTEWQRRLLSGDEYARQLEYWRDQLRDVPGELQLPSDKSRPQTQTYSGATLVFELCR